MNNLPAHRIALLNNKTDKILHTNDIGNLWLVSDKNTLHTTLKRYVKAGLLFRLYRGLYSTLPINKLDPKLVGAKAINDYCYISLHTVLFEEGYISQIPYHYTFVGRKSKKFRIYNYSYICRQMKSLFLYNSEGVYELNGVMIARPERAIADILYFNPLQSFDREVDWNVVKKIQEKIGYPLTPARYDFTKSKRRVAQV